MLTFDLFELRAALFWVHKVWIVFDGFITFQFVLHLRTSLHLWSIFITFEGFVTFVVNYYICDVNRCLAWTHIIGLVQIINSALFGGRYFVLHVINLYHLSYLMMIDRRCQCICIFHLCPGLHAEAKIAIFHVLQKIASLTIFCVSFFAVLCHVNNYWSPERVVHFTKFAKIEKNRKSDDFCITCDFSQLFVMLIITKPDRVADLTKFAKIAKSRNFDDFQRYLRFLTVLCHVDVQFSRVHDHLGLKWFADSTKFAISPKSFRFTCHFGSAIKVCHPAKADAAL